MYTNLKESEKLTVLAYLQESLHASWFWFYVKLVFNQIEHNYN